MASIAILSLRMSLSSYNMYKKLMEHATPFHENLNYVTTFEI